MTIFFTSEREPLMRNEELIMKVADQIRFEPDSYNQQVWATGSECDIRACCAGHAMILSGQWRWLGPDSLQGVFVSTDLHPEGKGLKSGHSNYRLVPLVEYREPAGEATRLLGLTEDEAALLFHDTAVAGEWEDTFDIGSGQRRICSFEPMPMHDALTKIAGGAEVESLIADAGDVKEFL